MSTHGPVNGPLIGSGRDVGVDLGKSRRIVIIFTFPKERVSDCVGESGANLVDYT